MPELVAAARCAVAVEICSGLRKLEFASTAGASGESSQVSAEFARKEPLPCGESVHIPLGMRDGRLRVLIGVPRLVEKKDPRLLLTRSSVMAMECLLLERLEAVFSDLWLPTHRRRSSRTLHSVRRDDLCQAHCLRRCRHSEWEVVDTALSSEVLRRLGASQWTYSRVGPN
jgi:hypothetical protein